MLQTTHETVEVQYTDRVVDASVIKKTLIPMVQRVQNTLPKSPSNINGHTTTDLPDKVQTELDARHSVSNTCATLKAVS